MEPKIFWSALSGKGLGQKRAFSNKTLILMGDWCRKADTEKPEEIPAKVRMLVIRP